MPLAKGALIQFVAAIAVMVLTATWNDVAQAASVQKKGKASAAKASPAAAAAQQYVTAMAFGDHLGVARLDFSCLYRIVSASSKRVEKMPPESDPVYAACWTPIANANNSAVEQRNLAMDVLWPGKGRLVFFGEELSRYPASAFVMELVGHSPPGSGLSSEVVSTSPLPAASFRLRDKVLPAQATLVRLRITYKDPLTSPATYAAGAYKWTNTVKRPRQALKAVTLKWVVLSGLRKQGFPTDVAVLNLPVSRLEDETAGLREAIPFVTDVSGFDAGSAAWWNSDETSGLLIAAVGRAALFPELSDRVAMLNRILIINPGQVEALTLLTRDLYASILRDATATHKFSFSDPVVGARFDELYWDTYAQTTRMDIALGMEMGGLTKPTTADALYRLIPAMEKLSQVRPEDSENRLRLGTAYRWNNDQAAAINTHEKLLAETPTQRTLFRSRVLVALAWSRIAKVAWNRILDDPIIVDAYKAAEEAFTLTDLPVDKFLASYTMAYSLAFMPHRDNQKMLEHLTEARRWFQQAAGSSDAPWQYLLSNDTLKGVVAADPLFKPLLTSSAG